MEKDTCQRCGETNDPDTRSLFMACFYEMQELGLPFEEIKSGERKFYVLEVCKDCRGDWMGAIKTWFQNPPKKESCGSGIFVRRNGATVEISQEEWDREHPSQEPARFNP